MEINKQLMQTHCGVAASRYALSMPTHAAFVGGIQGTSVPAAGIAVRLRNEVSVGFGVDAPFNTTNVTRSALVGTDLR